MSRSLLCITVLLLMLAPATGRAAKGCANKKCHKQVFRGSVVHGPVRAGSCTGCHRPRGKLPKGKHAKNAFTLIKGDKPCLACHKDLARQIKQGKVHKPLSRSGCSKCHKPHSTNTKFLLKGKTVAEQCF